MGARDAALGDAAPVVELRGVRKRFGNREAVQGLELVIPRGATYGLLGPNGAGKTTAIRMLLRILEPDAGEIRVFGEPPFPRRSRCITGRCSAVSTRPAARPR